MVERAVILSRGGPLRFEPLLAVEGGGLREPAAHAASTRPRTEADLKRAAREAIETALREAGGRIYGPGGAAALLGVKPTTLASRIRAHRIKRRP